ncbi:MAG: hypothetical protein NC350_02095 [Corallococcus sp.]|nr:hypothetical protein [Corallococcus sp.]
MQQKNWDKYEVALLIEAYQKIKRGEVDKNSALMTLSQNLRQMAQNDGVIIDDTFRNLNGMQWQIALMDKAFNNETYENHAPSQLFVEIVSLYKNNPQGFQSILAESQKKIAGQVDVNSKTLKELFIEWLGQNHSHLSALSVVRNIENVSAYAVKHKLSKKEFWQFTDYKDFNIVRVKVSGSKLFRISHGIEHKMFEKNGMLYSAFLKLHFGEAPKPIVVEKPKSAQQEAAPPVVEDNPDEQPKQSAEVVEPILATIPVEESIEKTYDFAHPQNLAFTKPIYASYKGRSLKEANNWRKIYVSFCIIIAHSCNLRPLIGKSLSDAVRMDFGTFRMIDLMQKPIKIADDLYVEGNLSATDIMKKLTVLLAWANIPYEDVVIRYVHRDDVFAIAKPTQPDIKSTVRTELKAKLDGSKLDQYIQWLQDEGKSINTARSYASALRTVTRYAQERGLLNGSLFDVANDDLQSVINDITSNAEFKEFNNIKHNSLTAALVAYQMFCLGEHFAIPLAQGERKTRQRAEKQQIVCPDDLRELLIKKFPYGIRVDSPIDLTKLQRFAEAFQVELAQDEELLKEQIKVGGLSFEGKYYFIADETVIAITDKINAIFDEGYTLVYFDKLLNQNFDRFDEQHISSSELLREVVRRCSADWFVSKNFVRNESERINEADAVEQEFENVWGDSVTHTYNDMYQLLPYMPEDTIRRYLSISKKFVWSSFETFAWIDKIIISDEERQAILDYVSTECDATGHAAIGNVPQGNIAEVNYDFSQTAIETAIYRLILQDHFALKGKLLTRKDNSTDALTLAKDYCDGKDELTFTELNDYVTAINGVERRQITFEAAYDQMVRVQENKFVADRFVRFDVAAIDNLLDDIIEGDFASIRSIATFVMFPNCGHTWTHYLVESFCLKYSNKYKLQIINYNDKNAGMIVRKECNFSYEDMLAIVAANCKLPLQADIIGQYFFDNGYSTRKKASIIDRALSKAKQMREGQ